MPTYSLEQNTRGTRILEFEWHSDPPNNLIRHTNIIGKLQISSFYKRCFWMCPIKLHLLLRNYEKINNCKEQTCVEQSCGRPMSWFHMHGAPQLVLRLWLSRFHLKAHPLWGIFPSLGRGKIYLEWKLSWVSLPLKTGHWLGKQVHVQKCGSSIDRSASLLEFCCSSSLRTFCLEHRPPRPLCVPEGFVWFHLTMHLAYFLLLLLSTLH